MDVLLSMSYSAFNLIMDKSVSISEIIMMDNVNTDTLSTAIDSRVEEFSENYSEYSTYSETMKTVLKCMLRPNSVFDSDATEEAGENAYLTALNAPITVD